MPPDVAFVPATEALLRSIQVAQAQKCDAEHSFDDVSAVLSGFALAAIHQRGAVLGAAGIFNHHPGRAEAWFLAGVGAGEHLWPILRMMRWVIDTRPCRRLEMTSLPDSWFTHLLAKRLGFEREGVLRKAHPNGQDLVMYSRVRE